MDIYNDYKYMILTLLGGVTVGVCEGGGQWRDFRPVRLVAVEEDEVAAINSYG